MSVSVFVNHLSVVSRNLAATEQFLTRVIRCERHQREGWYRLPGSATVIHVIELEDAVVPPDTDYFHYYTHVALEVASLRFITAESLKLGLRVFQMSSQGEERDIVSGTDSLDFGLATVFVQDPDRNLWEFAQRGHSWEALWE
jgi:catechol 2,3-dioxygenase-like lactoylglutathione lyase family enzyme